MEFFEREILGFYKTSGRTLPWRKSKISAYEVWVSEIFLQQTQVSRVIAYYKRFLKRFPNAKTLARASWQQFLPYYQGLGYYQRGRNMLKTARVVVEKHGGRFPADKNKLMALPGIGEYTANAILAFAYKKNHLAFDTNLQRVFGRFLYGDKNADINKEKIQKQLHSNNAQVNSAIMDFANLVCVKTPKCEVCPLSKRCRYFKESGRSEIQKTSGKTNSFPTKKAQVYLWLHKDHKQYFSKSKVFQPFVLPTGINTREKIKQFFLKKYRLTVSVRPPHKKIYIGKKPTLFVNAQILLGKNPFYAFSKEQIK